MDRAEQAAEFMRSGYNCAQSILKAYAQEAGLTREEDAILMASALGGGIGRTGYVCGALSGAALILGRRFGYKDPADTAGRDRVYTLVARLVDKFKTEHGTVMCSDLLGFDIRNAAKLKEARESGVFQQRCPVFVRSAGGLLEEILANPQG
jgi:C_GCAxxG_C_C family probable redox protein